MTEHIKSEIRMLNQVLLAIVLMVNYAFFLSLNNTIFPWFALVGASVGLTIILFCWSGKKYLLFNIALLALTAAYSLACNWSTIFNIH